LHRPQGKLFFPRLQDPQMKELQPAQRVSWPSEYSGETARPQHAQYHGITDKGGPAITIKEPYPPHAVKDQQCNQMIRQENCP
jgi:hypothetical protein